PSGGVLLFRGRHRRIFLMKAPRRLFFPGSRGEVTAMDQHDERIEIARRPVVLKLPEEDKVRIERDIEFPGSDGRLEALDIVSPPDAPGTAGIPVVVIVSGAPDPGFKQVLGCRFKEMEWSVGWAKLLAASGLAAATYTNRDPRADLDSLLLFLRQNADTLG